MQGPERIGLSAGLSSSIEPLVRNKEVIFPLSSGVITHNRSISSPNPSPGKMMPHEQHIGSSIPFVRSRTAPQGNVLLGKLEESAQQIQRSRSDSLNEINDFKNNDWSWQPPRSTPASPSPQPQQADPFDPDSEEQALFEQRLCEDVYGVAVRKINHNGKSNLRYVKCMYVDASNVVQTEEIASNAPQHASSNLSVSSRHSKGSRVSLQRLLGKGSRHSKKNKSSNDSADAQRSLLRETEPNDETEHSSPYNGKVRVLSWGKKKEVTVPMDKFTAVKKGKINYRTRRNPCDPSRIVSLVTSDIHSEHQNYVNNNTVSLDIEAPTRLDRDKFAKAFARFLNVPLIEEADIMRALPAMPVSTGFPHQQNNHRPMSSQNDGNRSIARSIRSDATPLSWKDPQPNDNSIPGITLTASNSQTTNELGIGPHNRSSSWKQINAPLPVVTMRGISAQSNPGKSFAAKPPRSNRRSISGGSTGAAAPLIHSSIVNNASSKGDIKFPINTGGSSRTGSEVDDPPLASLPSSSHSRGASNYISTSLNHNNNAASNNPSTTIPSSTNKKGKMVLEIPVTAKSKLSKNSNHNHATGTPATSAISAHIHTQSTTPSTPATAITNININNVSRDTTTDDSECMSMVSSITGVGFDQDLVEELHLALEKMKGELEESRAEASRAVKVAEQAIQSAENSSSKDWNNTVTHKAAEAAASAQKKSAEAMAKARVAEERLAMERKNATLRKKQVEKAEQQAAHWQTRAAAAEVQRFAVAEELESERKKNQDLTLQAHWQSKADPSEIQRMAVAEALDGERKKNQDLVLQAEIAVTGGSKHSRSAFDPFETTAASLPQSTAASESAEVGRLRSKLAMESARRRKLLDELQDLRGTIRVYCRLMEPSLTARKKPAVIDMVSNEVLMLHRNRSPPGSQNQRHNNDSHTNPLCFDFDGILSSDMDQQEVYREFEAICASVLEGFKICFMSYGQADAGKTHTMLGDVLCNRTNHSVSIENEGIHLRSMQQLFSLLERRKDEFQDTVTLTLVEVHSERLIDLLAGTDSGEKRGRVENRKSSNSGKRPPEIDNPKSPTQQQKLEIKTNRDGETVVRGVVVVDLASYEEVIGVWTESLANRSRRLSEQKVEDPIAYERDSHVVATLSVTSKNLSTGSTSSGRMQFVDFASSDMTTKRGPGGVSTFLSSSSVRKLLSSSASDQGWKFTNRSLNTVREVVLARSQYQRSVPYRHSTITHILSDSLEADTKVVFIACVSSEQEDVPNTTCTLQLAQEMRKVIVGKATRHVTIA